MRHHEAGLEVELDGELTEHGLREHADDETEGEPREVASPRDPHQAAEHGHDHRDRHRAGEEPVRVLDEPVLARDCEAVQLACRQLSPTGQPSPESVSRTAPPVTMMIVSRIAATSVMRRYASGLRCGTRMRR